MDATSKTPTASKTTANPTKPKSSTVHSVVVAVRLLEYLAETGRPQRVTDIAAHLGMTKARVSRHLSTLSDLRMVVKTPDNSGYRLGSMLFRLANAALDQYEITNIAYRYMVVLKNQISETILLAIPAGGDAVIVSTIASGKPFTPQIPRGTRWSAPTSPTGRLILAYAAETTRERILARRTERDTDLDVDFEPQALRQRMAKIRSQFYEFDENPYDTGYSGLVVPLFNHLELLEAALTVVYPLRANDPNHETRYVKIMKETAVEISRVLGSVEMAESMAATI